MKKNDKINSESERIANKIKEKNKINDISINKEKSVNNFNNEFIPEFNHWLSIEEQKEKTKEIEDVTKKK
jgi:hypothetical protein